MPITREVITDLWPVFLSGEASADTRALVEDFLQHDPEFARGIRQERPHSVPSPPKKQNRTPPVRQKGYTVQTCATASQGCFWSWSGPF